MKMCVGSQMEQSHFRRWNMLSSHKQKQVLHCLHCNKLSTDICGLPNMKLVKVIKLSV